MPKTFYFCLRVSKCPAAISAAATGKASETGTWGDYLPRMRAVWDVPWRRIRARRYSPDSWFPVLGLGRCHCSFSRFLVCELIRQDFEISLFRHRAQQSGNLMAGLAGFGIGEIPSTRPRNSRSREQQPPPHFPENTENPLAAGALVAAWQKWGLKRTRPILTL